MRAPGRHRDGAAPDRSQERFARERVEVDRRAVLLPPERDDDAGFERDDDAFERDEDAFEREDDDARDEDAFERDDAERDREVVARPLDERR